jgi:hypothetical protein
LEGVWLVRWNNKGNEQSEKYTFFYGKGNESHQFRTGLFVHKRITSAFKGAEFVSDSMSYIVLGGCWCDIFCRHMPHQRINVMIQMTISMMNYKGYLISYVSTVWKLYGDFNAQVGRKDI